MSGGQGHTEQRRTGGRKETMEQSMTAIEAARLIDWLLSKGLTAEDAAECIKYIATGIQPTAQ